MRARWSQIMGVALVVVALGTGAAAFQVDPDSVTQVSTTPNGLWVPAALSGEIVHIDAGSGEITARVHVSESGAELEVAEIEGKVVVVDRTAGRVSLIDPGLHEVIRQVETLTAGPGLVDIGPESIVLAAGSEVAIVDLDVTTSISFELDSAVLSLAALGEGGVAAGTNSVTAFDSAQPGDPVPDADVRVVRVGDLVVELDGTEVGEFGGTQRRCLSVAFGPDAKVTGDPSGLVVGVDRGLVQVADIESGTCRRIRLGSTTMDVALPVTADGMVFVPEPSAGVVHIFDPNKGRSSEHRVAFGASKLRVRSRDKIVVAYAADSTFATLLDADGVVKIIDTAPDDQLIQAVLADDGSSAVVGGDSDAPAVGLDDVEGDDRAAEAPVIDAAVLAAIIANPELPDPATTNPAEPDPTADELVANFAFSSATVAVGSEVRFVDESIGSPDSWIWDFGDGTGAQGPEVAHTWLVPGTYPVTLHISRGDLAAQISLAIIVVPSDVALPPSANFVFSATVVDVGDTVTFGDRSVGEIERWRWDFGDGTSASSRNADKAWDRVGIYTVVLTVTNQQGSDSATIVVEVRAGLQAPVAVVSASTQLVEVGQPVAFTGASRTDPAAFSWDFGDSRTATGASVTHVFLDVGSYTVTLLASNDAGNSEARIDITVEPATVAPIAQIATLPLIVEVGEVVTLTSISSNAPDSTEWSFGDGETAVGTSVVHTWARPGAYLVGLTVSNQAGSSSTIVTVDIVAALPPPLAVITGFEQFPWVGDATTFSESSVDATSWLWEFGDGGTSVSATSLHTFSSIGLKTVTLTVSNRNGTDSASVTVEPRLKPIADFSILPVAPRGGELVTFTSEFLSENAVSWAWDFGDSATSIAQNPQHAFAASGSYPVVLIVTTAAGDQDTSLPRVVVVDPAPPALSGIRTSDPAITLETVTIQALAPSSGPITTYEIDFGDGTATQLGLSATFQRVYPAAGIYTVRMRAQGPLGDWSAWVSTNLAVVDPAPPQIAIASSVPPSALLGFVTLTGEALVGSGPIDTWAWEITGASGTVVLGGRVVTHNFADAGTYQLALTATGPVTAATVSQSLTITLPPPPVVTSLVASPSLATTGVTAVQFIPSTTGSVDEWAWDYENGGTNFVAGTSLGEHIFNTAGPHTVWLRVTGPFGRTDTRSVVVIVQDPPPPLVAGFSSNVTFLDVVFTDTSTGPPVDSWSWNFGDGSVIETSSNPSHTYGAAGTYTVTLTVTSGLETSAPFSASVTVG